MKEAWHGGDRPEAPTKARQARGQRPRSHLPRVPDLAHGPLCAQDTSFALTDVDEPHTRRSCRSRVLEQSAAAHLQERT